MVSVSLDEQQYDSLLHASTSIRDSVYIMNNTLSDLNTKVAYIYDWVQYSSCVLLMVFFAVMMISTVYMFGIGKIWRGKD